MGLLDGDLAQIVHGAFSGILLDGTLHRRIMADNGKGGFTQQPDANQPIKVMVDPADEQMRNAAGEEFNERDVKLLFLAHGVAWPKLDDELTVATGAHAGRYHILNPITLDTAQSHYICRGRKK